MQNKTERIKRYALCILGLFISAQGVAITKLGELGVSPISSVANVLSLKFSMLSLGNWLIIWNCILIVGQLIILRSKFQWIQLLQIPLSFLFGYFTDFGMWLFTRIAPEQYALRLAYIAIGTVLLGFGIACCVIANTIMNSGEAFVKAISDTTHGDFGNLKIGFDISCVVLALVLSLLFFDGAIVGTREGTVIAALCTGIVVKFFTARLRTPLTHALMRKAEAQ